MNPKKTPAQKKRSGNPGKRPIDPPVVAPPGIPAPPAWLAGAALEEWHRVAPVLDAMGAISALDRAALADYCRCVARLDELEAIIDAKGAVVEGRNRSVDEDGDRMQIKNPAWTLIDRVRKALQKYCEMFGFAPGPRGRLALPEPPEDESDPLLD